MKHMHSLIFINELILGQ